MATGIKTGTLKKWFDEKGFGFIIPQDSGKDVFVHITAFDRNNTRKPRVGDEIYYSLAVEKGKTKAVGARIKGVEAISKPPRPRHKKPNTRSNRHTFKAVFFVIGLIFMAAYYGYNQFVGTKQWSTSPTTTSTSSQNYKCDGRTHCSEMTSCEEAIFFINNCPGTKMDGDGDGRPCERQLCN